MNRIIQLVVFVCLALGSVTAMAHTWYVELDGSGDFTTIQEAVDAAASGDEIRIGPGTYVGDPGAGADQAALVMVPADYVLTFVGSGADQTILSGVGFEAFDSYNGFGFDGSTGRAESVVIEDVGFVDFASFAALLVADHIEMTRCEFAASCDRGAAVVEVNSAVVDDCDFLCQITGLQVSLDSRDVNVTNCFFAGDVGIWTAGYGIGMAVVDCEFDVSNGGIFLAPNAEASVRNCRINVTADPSSSAFVFGIYANTISTLELFDTLIAHSHPNGPDPDESAAITGGGLDMQITGSGNTITSDLCCLSIVGSPEFDFAGNHILRTSDDAHFVRSIDFHSVSGHPVDLANNYWGTENAPEIEFWIIDSNDSPANDVNVNFIPFAGGPIATEEASWSDVKALYR